MYFTVPGEEVGIKNEQVGDISLLPAQMERIGIHPLLDSCFSTHGNRKGLNHVQGWA